MPALIKAPSSAPPFAVQAIVLEEDTGLVLSADVRVKDVDEHPIRLMTGLLSSETIAIGTAVLRRGTPHRIFAVVHDMDQTPHCRQEWVVSALVQVMQLCEQLCDQENIQSIAIQRLGSVFGKLDTFWFENELLEQSRDSPLKQIWLMD